MDGTKKKRVIILTGGGSAGHVTPNIALIPQLAAEGFELHYIGTEDGIERRLIEPRGDIAYHAIPAGKLRRYFSLKNLSDPFRVNKGVTAAKRLMRRLEPCVVFSKGGFVSVPVVLAAKGRCPIICHESDYTPGLANRIAARYATTVLVTFEDTLEHVKKRKGRRAVWTGTPIRSELFRGSRQRGLDFLGFSGEKPVILVMGGSLGATAVNDAVRAAMGSLGKSFDLVHLCGKGKLDGSMELSCYRQYEYVSDELPDILAATDLVISRSGANAVFEFLALGKPALFIPLPLGASRGDQILNAEYCVKRGYSLVLAQEELNSESLVEKVNELYLKRARFIERMRSDGANVGTERVLDEILKAACGGK